MHFDLKAIVMLMGGAQGLFLSLLLLRKGRRADGYLAALILAYSIGICSIALGFSGAYLALPHLVGTTTALPFLYGPLHYLYVRELVSTPDNTMVRGAKWIHRSSFDSRGRNGPTINRSLLHFTPFIGYTIYLLPFYLESTAYKRSFFESMMAGDAPVLLDVMAGLKAVHGMTYLIATLILLGGYSAISKDLRIRKDSGIRKESVLKRPRASHVSPSFMRWLRRLTLVTAALWLLNLVLIGLDTLGIATLNGVDAVMGIAMACAIYGIGYLGVRRTDIFAPVNVTNDAPRYERSSLDAAEAAIQARRLHAVLQRDALYRQSGLKLPDLAEALDVSPHHLSQVINEHLGKNFFDLVNAYRVKEAQRLLVDPDFAHWTMLAIAEEVGFGSRSAFNAAFKKQLGVTPSGFRKRSLQATS